MNLPAVNRRQLLGPGALAALASLLASNASARAVSACSSAMTTDLGAFKATRVFTGDDGHSHFEEIEFKGETLPFRLQGEQKPTPGFFKYYNSKATRITILRGPPNLDLPWHTAPTNAAEFFFMVQGSNTLITRSGNKLMLPGSIVLFEDATGSGHAGKVGPEGYTVINVALA